MSGAEHQRVWNWSRGHKLAGPEQTGQWLRPAERNCGEGSCSNGSTLKTQSSSFC
jgi:hypothetical protein